MTGRYQLDGTPNLTCEDGTRHHAVDGWEGTHNRSVAGSRPASPTGCSTHSEQGKWLWRGRADPCIVRTPLVGTDAFFSCPEHPHESPGSPFLPDAPGNPNAIRLRASAARARWGCGQDADGLKGWHGRLWPGAMLGAFELVVAHLALHRSGEGPQPALGQQHGQQLVDHHADRGGELLRGERPPGRSPGGG